MLIPMSADVRELLIHTRDRVLPGTLSTPPDPIGVVLFAHGSGSSRLSPRNRMVASRLVSGGLATLLFDLLDSDEAADRSAVFDIPLLAERLEDATSWLQESGVTLPVGYFGASTGAGAALWAAAELGTTVRAVVSRGGRPDLAASRLAVVTAPTLLIVGGHDETVLELNQEARARMHGPTLLEVVPGASHLFEEPGALETVATLATRWFRAHLGGIVED